MSLKQKAAKGVVWTAIRNSGNQVITFAVFSILARLLGPESFGLVSLSNIFFALMQVFVDQGFSQAIVQRKNLEPEHLDTAFWTSIGMGTFMMMLSVAVSGFIAQLYKQPAVAPIICWLSITFVCSGFESVQSAILTRELKFKTLSIRTLVASSLGGVVGVIMAFLGYGVWSLVGQTLAAAITGVIVLWSSTNWRPGFKVSKRHFNDLFSYGINVVGNDLLNFLNRRSDDFLIGYYLGPIALGYYSIAYRMLTVTSQLMISTIQRISMPVFSQIQHEPERLKQAFYKAIRITNLSAFPAFLCLSVLAPELVTILFGDKWEPSVPAMQILGLVGFLHAGFFYNGPMLMAVGKPHWQLRYNCFQALCNVTCFFIAVQWGFVAVAASYTIRSYLTSPVNVWLVRKALRIRVKDYLRQFAIPLLAALVMTIVIFGAKYVLQGLLDVRLLLVAYLIIGVISYIATILLISPVLFQEGMNMVLLIVPSRFRKSA